MGRKKKLKILMLNYEFPPLGGGAANANYYLLKEFSKMKDINIDLITSSALNKFEIEKFSNNINIYKLKINKKSVHYWTTLELLEWTLKTYLLTKKLIKERDYDLCHCWFGWPSGIIGYLNRKKVPYIVALRGSDVPGYNIRIKLLDKLLFSWISKIVWRNSKEIISNSEGLKKLALKTLNTNIKVIYNGINVNEFKPLKRKKISKTINLISTGRLIERKGYIYLIKALKGLNNIKLTLIGTGNQEEELKSLAKDLNINVEFKGAVDHSKIVKNLQKADIFVLPSLNEGMSNSILEAMASGLPIITTDTGGSKELIKGNGFIVKKESVSDLRKVLKEYLKDNSLIKSQGKRSRKLAEKMSWKNVAENYVGFI